MLNFHFMESDKLRTVSISYKNLKRELLLSSNQVNTLHAFLRDIMKNDILIINTNIGLDIYYYAPISCDEIILNAFLLIANSNQKNRNDYFVKVLNSDVEIKLATNYFFNKLLKNPLLLKSYMKSLSYQLNSKNKSNNLIINNLIALWKDIILNMDDDLGVQKIIPYLVHFQDHNLNDENKLIFKKLINEALSVSRIN